MAYTQSLTTMTNFFYDSDYSDSQPYAEEVVTQRSSNWPDNYAANWLTYTSQPSTDIHCNTWTAPGNALGMYGMPVHEPEPLWPAGHLDFVSASTISNPADDRFISTSPLHQFPLPDNGGQFSQPHELLVHHEATLAGVEKTFFPYADLTSAPADIRPVQKPITYAQRKHDSAFRPPASHSRYAPYPLGSERSPNHDGDPRAFVYQCQWSDDTRSCGAVVAHNRNAISHHLQTEHAVRLQADHTSQNCRWGKCRKSMRRESIPRHILAVHMKEKVLCTDCDSRFARTDSLQRHQRTCCLAKGEKVALALTG